MSCTRRVKFTDKFMCFSLLNALLQRFFYIGFPQSIVNLLACQRVFPQLLMDIKPVREQH